MARRWRWRPRGRRWGKGWTAAARCRHGRGEVVGMAPASSAGSTLSALWKSRQTAQITFQSDMSVVYPCSASSAKLCVRQAAAVY